MGNILDFLGFKKKKEEAKKITDFHLLVVEDTEELLDVLRLAKFPEQIKITMVTSGVQAIQTLTTEKIDAILADINMPDMDLLNKELNVRCGEIPVFRMSGQYDHFVNLVLKKPFGIKEYQQAVVQLYGLAKVIKRAS
jgi:DNA-binding response OmpR family regulator